MVNFKFLIALSLFCIIAAIVNNLRLPDDKSVKWIGGQEILKREEAK
jgi:hypothetical protein